ncbi:bifunctional folylpolyglutamate synthase/dihydrofolate synthase [Saliterribacillus persicus]|uniref:tetrahydrofolate synthase n=1 Tax=Saliterribacillus persicus TaxID=930114 RepID=A0A368XFH9_9BACI|nr:folylpolyglutamate synthase/dihydrofolate synthase family protein [Saliterribacillus persicus]RCW66389.1 dihydrofolate synthase/folylpolyglutamate synthase [Saliterribacillus persicus]
MFQYVHEIDHFLDSRANLGIKPGLDRMYFLLEAQKHPENRLKAIHIAGTNGKGSTLTYIESVLSTSHYKVGTFTSPSMSTRNDMIKINGTPLFDKDFLKYFNQLSESIEQLDKVGDSPSSFEIIVAIAIGYLADHADITILEAGMGGREDATNCITPILSVITTIGFDHTSFLGDTLEKIASHKAGIIKENIPVVIGKVPKEAIDVIRSEAEKKNAPVTEFGKDFSMEAKLETGRFTFRSDHHVLNLQTKMNGQHQLENASLAVMAVLKLNLNIASTDIIKGIQSAQLLGRFEKIHEDPEIIIDAAHNTEGVIAFLETVKKFYPNRKKQVIFAVYKDKPISQMLEKIESVFQEIAFTTFDHPRACNAERLYEMSKLERKSFNKNWEKLIDDMVSDGEAPLTFIVGSLEFVALVRRKLV